LKTDSQTEITQKPTLAVLDNTPATIFVGESVRYAEVSISQTAAGGQAVTISEGANSPVDVGFQLLVKPHVIPESRQVKLLMIPTLRDLAGNSATQPGFDTFAIGNQSIDLPRVAASTVVTEMLLEDGETAVIGGLIREIKTESVVKWPILGDIPLLGYLFKNIQVNKEKRHVLLFVTLRIMRSPKAAKQALNDQLRERENEAAREFWEDIRREKYEPPPVAVPGEKKPEEGKTPEKAAGGTSSRSGFKAIEEETAADDKDASGSRDSNRRTTVRRW
jgi:general secretion pathway protein D